MEPEEFKNSTQNTLKTKLKYYTLDGKLLINLESQGDRLITNNTAIDSRSIKCTASSWSDCVEDNIDNAGAVEQLGGMVLGSYCAAGLAAGCLIDVHAEISRGIYC